MFDDPFDKYFDGPGAGSSEAGAPSGPAAQPKAASYPKTRAEAEALGYKPLLDTAPEIQPCQYGYPCNDCGYCH